MGIGTNAEQLILEYIKDSYPSSFRTFELSEVANASYQNTFTHLRSLEKEQIIYRIGRGQWIYNKDGNYEEYKKKKIRSVNTLRYPIEMWPYEKGLIWQLKSIKNRCKKNHLEFDITKEDLFELWEKQKGKCILSDIPLTFIKGNGWQVPTNGSVDRIDSNKGYTKDNIRLLCWQANLMKGQLNDEELIIFCKLIYKRHQSREVV